MIKPIIIIPARMAARRLPGKPMLDIGGLPMIVRVMNAACEADIAAVYVAAGDREIYDAVRDHGGNAVMTSQDVASGTDRVHAALKEISQCERDGEYTHIINLQGDLPTINPDVIKLVMRPFAQGGVDITTLVNRFEDAQQAANPADVKAVISWQGRSREEGAIGRALYFTRAVAPYGEGAELYHHIGIYGFTAEALERFTALSPSPLEKVEKLEQLRALEDGMRIDVCLTEHAPYGVDTQEDLARAREFFGGEAVG